MMHIYVTVEVNISVIHVCILIQELCCFFLKIVFTPLICYGLSDLVYWYLLVRLWVELFISKRPNTSRNCNQKKNINLEQMQQK